MTLLQWIGMVYLACMLVVGALFVVGILITARARRIWNDPTASVDALIWASNVLGLRSSSGDMAEETYHHIHAHDFTGESGR
jgi:hypothetical protein